MSEREPASIQYKNDLTLDRLKEVLSYDPETGFFVWLVQLGWKGPVGKRAGTRHSRGYVHIMIDQKLYLVHRLAWFYVAGQWPSNQIDHLDCDRSNNRFANLRQATTSQNNQNRQKRPGGASKFKGVSWHVQNRMWEARIKRDRQQIRLGLYRTEEEAHAAYCKAANEMFGSFARAA
ncbi:HNH endonuclease [Nitrobacter sp. TKz-YC02]|uniref:HNH endonuclease n=1 Tax=Nitrobacter sp. TKz-YC02 TaxID=3398704 RepID=UPI003CE93C1E